MSSAGARELCAVSTTAGLRVRANVVQGPGLRTPRRHGGVCRFERINAVRCHTSGGTIVHIALHPKMDSQGREASFDRSWHGWGGGAAGPS
ncbi:hypothetical protein GY45DRAFT_767567 [Cubamyces sp. BRFM 1775]|nr:hypothetical protein GY45DRAFT_767567 [Cubamyces sp. BRFM 1775]